MWTAKIVLLVLELLIAGGWFDAILSKREKRCALFSIPILFGLCFVPQLRAPLVRAYAAPCAWFLLTAIFCATEHPIGALLAAAFGGLIGWKLADTFPLFPEPGLFTAVPTALLSVFYCRDRNAKALAIAAAPFVMLFFRAVGDYMLFQSAVLELGDGDSLTAQSAGLFLLLTGGLVLNRFPVRFRRLRSAA